MEMGKTWVRAVLKWKSTRIRKFEVCLEKDDQM